MSQSAPAVHSVHFYGSHGALLDRLCGVVCSGLLVGNSVLLVATPGHREGLVKCLERLEVDVRKYAREGQFSMFDAEELLSTFMRGGVPDPKLFRTSVGKLLTEAKKAARGKDEGLTVFGEMVAVLWEQRNKAGALQLERLWNESLKGRAFHLHCAYPQWLLENDGAGMRDIAETHSHIVGGSAYVA
jgi:hypothetical protein